MTQQPDPQFREWLLKRKLKDSLTARFLLRFHASLLLLGSIAAGWLANRLLFQVGVDSMIIRHPVAVLAAYVAFLFGLQLWIRYSGINEYLDERRSKELLEVPQMPDRDNPEPGSDWSPNVTGLDGDGCMILILIIVVLAILYAMGGYLVVHAADLFADVVFELLLAAGLLRGIHRIDRSGLERIFPSVTLWAVSLTLIVTLLFGLWARNVYPQAKTVADVVKAVKEAPPASRK